MLKKILLLLLDIYQKYLRAALPASCRFVPSCSDYAKEAIQKYGCLCGTLKAARRVLRCHPFSHQCGYDPLM